MAHPTHIDPVTLELYRHRFAGAAEEMGITLRRTGYSPNIKERLDFSCAVFDGAGRMIAQAAHIPAHLGAMPASVSTILGKFDDWQPGDIVIVNDPFEGGNHLPDITMIGPIFIAGRTTPDFFAASRAHHADVGGMTPGSLPLSTEVAYCFTQVPQGSTCERPVRMSNSQPCQGQRRISPVRV